MGTKIKSLRIEDSLLSEIDLIIKEEEIQFNKLVNDALSEYLIRKKSKLKTIGNRIYLPIHLTNEELVLFINEFMKDFDNDYNCIAKVRKDKGGKGIDFQIDFFQEFKSKVIKKKRYSFSLNAFWEIEEILEHKINEDIFTCLRLNLSKTNSIQDILNYNINRKSSLELNSLFNDEKWKVLFEKRYPILKNN